MSNYTGDKTYGTYTLPNTSVSMNSINMKLDKVIEILERIDKKLNE